MKIVIIGTGNVAWHLLNTLQQGTHQVVQLVNLHSHKVSEEFEKFNIPLAINKVDINTSADIYIIAVSDTEIASLELPVLDNEQLILHTSGIADIDVLKHYGSNYGCLYPLQTLTKGMPVDFAKVPLIIEAVNLINKDLIMNFALSLSPYVLYLPLQKRRVLHLSAVLVNNFANHLYVEAKKLLDKESISFDLLKPLLAESVNKLNHLNPIEAQTGPAKRKDESTVSIHRQVIGENQLLLQIYELITIAIQTQSKN